MLLGYFFAVGEKFQRGGIYAVPLSCGRRAVGEYVSLVAVAAGAADLGAAHAVAVVIDVFKVFLVERNKK